MKRFVTKQPAHESEFGVMVRVGGAGAPNVVVSNTKVFYSPQKKDHEKIYI